MPVRCMSLVVHEDSVHIAWINSTISVDPNGKSSSLVSAVVTGHAEPRHLGSEMSDEVN